MTAFALDLPANDVPKQRWEERMVTVGMTAADLLAKKKYAEALQPWRTRTRRAHAFLRGVLRPDLDGDEKEEVEEVHAPGPNGHAVRVRLSPPGEGGPSLVLNYVEIWDPFGPTIYGPAHRHAGRLRGDAGRGRGGQYEERRGWDGGGGGVRGGRVGRAGGGQRGGQGRGCV